MSSARVKFKAAPMLCADGSRACFVRVIVRGDMFEPAALRALAERLIEVADEADELPSWTDDPPKKPAKSGGLS